MTDFSDTFARIHRIASRRMDVDCCDASNISTIEGIAERIEIKTRDPLAVAVRMICNSPFAASEQMRAIAAATEARASVPTMEVA